MALLEACPIEPDLGWRCAHVLGQLAQTAGRPASGPPAAPMPCPPLPHSPNTWVGAR